MTSSKCLRYYYDDPTMHGLCIIIEWIENPTFGWYQLWLLLFILICIRVAIECEKDKKRRFNDKIDERIKKVLLEEQQQPQSQPQRRFVFCSDCQVAGLDECVHSSASHSQAAQDLHLIYSTSHSD